MIIEHRTYKIKPGKLNEIIHLYGYESLDDRARRRKELSENETWQKFISQAIDFIENQESKILLPAKFSAIK
jgi:hypothetical protein